ncbi:CAP domain-containing protein [Tenacibaculum sp. 1_MG-2023]|uniref:CAP domain-containing protein n=1 Tax=Tenacibaculum sp. 1_MG-2023 TaxID=3062653 RepID=UPI0026E3266F|nr:CAP domain-containing protein [Tenacibaculum sp. 1_MG-2023]MDO6676827.1 CAP domain-containing protein [Tenacibaculum sp. 1_MG-2023]
MNNYPQKLLVLFCALIITSCSSNEAEIADSTPEMLTSIIEKPIEADVLDLINSYRVNNGFSSLNKLQTIKSQTNNHTNYMIEKEEISHDFFHQRKEYLTENANAIKIGENVAYGYSTAEAVVDAWIKSNGHKENIEGDYTHFEITAKKSDNGKWYYTNIFVKK